MFFVGFSLERIDESIDCFCVDHFPHFLHDSFPELTPLMAVLILELAHPSLDLLTHIWLTILMLWLLLNFLLVFWWRSSLSLPGSHE